jgi:hypothetical protein
VVLFICFLFSISAAFEFHLESGVMCQHNQTGAAESSQLEDNETTLKLVKRTDSGHNFNANASVSLRRLERSLDNDVLDAGIGSTDDAVNSFKLLHKTSHKPSATTDHYVNDAQSDNATSRVIPQHNHDTCSSVSDFYRKELLRNDVDPANNKT